MDLKYRNSSFGPEKAEFDWFTWAQYTWTPGLNDNPYSYGWEGEYSSRNWLAYHFAEYIGPDYNPALGFVRQRDIFQSLIRVKRRLYPETWDSLGIQGSLFGRYPFIGDTLELIRPEVLVDAQKKAGDYVSFAVDYTREELLESFSPVAGTSLDTGTFYGWQAVAVANTSASRTFSLETELASRPYYAGRRNGAEIGATWKPSSWFNINGEMERERVELPDTHFGVNIYKATANIQFSPTLVWSNIGQYDNISRRLGLNSRLRWTYRPGSDIFFIINQGLLNDPLDGWESAGSEFSAKINATFNF